MADYDWGPPPVDGYEATVSIAFLKNTNSRYDITPDVLKYIIIKALFENKDISTVLRFRDIKVSEYKSTRLETKY